MINNRTSCTAKPLAAIVAAIALTACASYAERGGGAVAQSAPIDPAAAGWDAAALAEAVEYVRARNSTGFLIVDDGRIIAEHYWPLPQSAVTFRNNFTHGTNADGVLLEDVASMQKSFIAILVGVAVDQGLLDVSRPVSSYIGEGWSAAPADREAAITVLNLLEMNSGLDESLGYEAPAGERFFYNTPAYAILKPVLEAAAGAPLDALTRDWLTAPTGMTDTEWRQRPEVFANVGNPTGLVTTPRDQAVMGQMLLDRGRAADGTVVVSEAQIEAMLTPSATNPAYGRLWWLNGGAYAIVPGGGRSEGPLIGTAPDDLYAALGALDRKLFVVPSRDLIVVRAGPAADDRDFNETLWHLLAAAMPAE